jgi:hypothetical protein
MRKFAILFAATVAATAVFAADAASPLTGRWTNGRVSMIQYKDAYTGVFKPPSGSHFAYEFREDGTYTFIGLMQTTMYNCTTSVFSQETGTYTSNGIEVNLHPQKNPYQMRYSCSPNSNKEAPGKLIERTYRFRVASGKLELMAAGDSAPQTFQRSAD